MLSVEEALQQIWEHGWTLPVVSTPATQALGLTLAEDIASDIDSPPYDKAMMDGYALVAADLESGAANLQLLEEITAGKTPSHTVRPGYTSRIMTGAPIPPGADAVVMIERSQLDPDDPRRVHLEACVAPGANILKQATALRQGATVLPAGTLIRPIEIGILAEVGRDTIPVTARPRITVLSTGDELVPAHVRPAAGQIRNSNGPMLEALAAETGATAVNLGVARDDRDHLASLVSDGLEADILILSGGVSAGTLDLVPAVLAAHGVEQVFHKVHMKPGKPVWFGRRITPDRQTLVFGLPGNPVSSLVGFHLFVRHALARLTGRPQRSPFELGYQLTEAFTNRGDRPVFFPARVSRQELDAPQIAPLDWKGSADLATLGQANALAYFAAGGEYEAGQFIAAVLL